MVAIAAGLLAVSPLARSEGQDLTPTESDTLLLSRMYWTVWVPSAGGQPPALPRELEQQLAQDGYHCRLVGDRASWAIAATDATGRTLTLDHLGQATLELADSPPVLLAPPAWEVVVRPHPALVRVGPVPPTGQGLLLHLDGEGRANLTGWIGPAVELQVIRPGFARWSARVPTHQSATIQLQRLSVDALVAGADELLRPLRWQEGTLAASDAQLPREPLDWARAEVLYREAAAVAEPPEVGRLLQRAGQIRRAGAAQQAVFEAQRLLRGDQLGSAWLTVQNGPRGTPWDDLLDALHGFILLEQAAQAAREQYLLGEPGVAAAKLEGVLAEDRQMLPANRQRLEARLAAYRAVGDALLTAERLGEAGQLEQALAAIDEGLAADRLRDVPGNQTRAKLRELGRQIRRQQAQEHLRGLEQALLEGRAAQAVAALEGVYRAAPAEMLPDQARVLVRQQAKTLSDRADRLREEGSPASLKEALAWYELLLLTLPAKSELRVRVLYFRGETHRLLEQGSDG